MASSSDRSAPSPARGTRSKSSKSRRTDASSSPAADIVDGWIDERLRALYEHDLKDPLPEDMLKLVRAATKRGGGTT